MARAYWRLNAQVGPSVKDTGALTTPLTSVVSGSYHWSVVRTLLHVIQHHNQLRDTSSQTAYGSGSERALKGHTNVYTLSDHYILSSYMYLQGQWPTKQGTKYAHLAPSHILTPVTIESSEVLGTETWRKCCICYVLFGPTLDAILYFA